MIPAPHPRRREPGRLQRPQTPERGQEVVLLEIHDAPGLKRLTLVHRYYVQGFTPDAAGVVVSSPSGGSRRLELLDFYAYGPDGLELGPRWDVAEEAWYPRTPASPAGPGSTADGP